MKHANLQCAIAIAKSERNNLLTLQFPAGIFELFVLLCMDHDTLAALQGLHQKIQEQEQRIAQQQGQINLLTSISPAKVKGGGIELAQPIRESFAPHLQIKPLTQAERNAVVKRYPKPGQLPKPITDENGLGARAITGASDKKWLLTNIPQFQRDAIDVLRMATSAWQSALTARSAEEQAKILLSAITDITGIAGDNAQKLAQAQLKTTFEAGGAKGAYTIMDLAGDSAEIDFNEHSLFQQAHIEALQDLKKYNLSIDGAKKDTPAKGQAGSNRPRFDRQAGRGQGGRQYGRFQGGNRNFDNRPNFQGGGRGRGRFNHSQYNNNGNSNSNSNNNSNQARD